MGAGGWEGYGQNKGSGSRGYTNNGESGGGTATIERAEAETGDTAITERAVAEVIQKTGMQRVAVRGQ